MEVCEKEFSADTRRFVDNSCVGIFVRYIKIPVRNRGQGGCVGSADDADME